MISSSESGNWVSVLLLGCCSLLMISGMFSRNSFFSIIKGSIL